MHQPPPRPGLCALTSLRGCRQALARGIGLLLFLLLPASLPAADPPAPVVPPPVEILPLPVPLVDPPVVEVPPAVPDPLQVIIPEALLLGQDDPQAVEDAGETPPEIAAPHAPARPGAFILRWDRYRTLVVIDHSAGLLKPCWVVTLSTMPEQIPTPRGLVTLARGQVVVAYRAQAYYDKDRILHFDARRARLSGVMAGDWSPDSFAVTPAKEVSSRDDSPSHPSNTGEVEKEVSAETQRDEYRRLMLTAIAIVEGNI
jgi:hypothetical protein